MVSQLRFRYHSPLAKADLQISGRLTPCSDDTTADRSLISCPKPTTSDREETVLPLQTSCVMILADHRT